MSAWYGCVVAPQFAAQALLHGRADADGPVVVMDGVKPWERVYAHNPSAYTKGIRRGMTRVEVETFGIVEFLRRSHAEEADAASWLMKCMEEFTPRIEQRTGSEDWKCVLDLRGTERLLGRPEVLATALIERADAAGFYLHLVVCANIDAGFCLARHDAQDASRSNARQVRVVPAGEEASILSALPVGALSLDETQTERFAAWGIETLGQLAALPEVELITRMGQAGKRLRQRARGESEDLLLAEPDAFRLEQSIAFDDAIDTVEQVLFSVNPMLEQMIARAREHAIALASITLSFTLEPCGDRAEEGHALDPMPDKFARTVRPAVPMLDRMLWLKMIQLDLEAHPAPQPIVRIMMIGEAGDQSRVQLGLFAPQMPEPARFEDTHARLVALVGEGNVGRVRPADSHARDSFEVVRFVLPAKDRALSSTGLSGKPPASALRRMRPPVEVRVWLRERALERFFFESRRYRVLRSYGPWRSSGDWWTPQVWSTDAWDVAAESDEGDLLVCVVAHDLVHDRWQMEALYD